MKYIPLVNIKQGSASVRRFSNGNTLPLIQLPFGMCAFCAQTSDKDSWFYHPSSRSFEGLRITHQPSPWIGDYGSLIFMPQKNKPCFSADSRWSGFRPEESVMCPHYMKVRLLRSNSVIEISPSERGGAIRIEFSDSSDNWLSVLPLSGESECRYFSDKNSLYGFVTNCNDEKALNFKMYFIVKFTDGNISESENICVNEDFSEKGNFVSGDKCGIHLKLTGNKLSAFVATSYISYAQAERNLYQDFSDKNFEDIKNNAESVWEEYLSRVEIEAFDEKQLKTFYSCMYRAFLYPHKCYEIDGSGMPVHYSPSTGKVLHGVRYTDNGFWDTYRTCYPFYSIAARKEYKEMAEGFINDYKESGWLPRWTSIGERGCMPSTLIDAVICDAAVKNIIDKDVLRTAFEGMLKHAKTEADDEDYGRNGCKEYCRLGFVPAEEHRESVNLTLDAAYGDWCISVVADLLGEEDIKKEFAERALNYRNLFDPDTGFMRAKNKKGEFCKNFSPFMWGKDYTEGSAWQNSFAVPHDINGLADLYGGKEKLEDKLDELFRTSPFYETEGYGAEIHEMTEMAAVDFGQCAISNQPSFHIPYIYSALGDVKKTSEIIKRITDELFSYKDDGFPGDEDNGSMALWYIFSCIGFYPFCPGKKEFVRTKKLVKSVKISGKEFDADSYSGNIIHYDELL